MRRSGYAGIHPNHNGEKAGSMTRAEIEKLLALDKRGCRRTSDWGVMGRAAHRAIHNQPFERLASMRAALRRYIEITETPGEMKWCAAALREIDYIRALAGLPPKLAGGH